MQKQNVMCVLSFKNNYIFFHIPKCGGTSIYQILPNMEKVELITDTHQTYKKTKKVFEKIDKKHFFKKSEKFTIIRNPFDRTISLFRYINEHTDHYLHKTIKGYSFTEFCLYLKDNEDESITSCYEHLCDENGNLDSKMKVFKLEEINYHVKEISKIVKADFPQIPHVNKSAFPFEVTDESEEIIMELFKQDFEKFYP